MSACKMRCILPHPKRAQLHRYPDHPKPLGHIFLAISGCFAYLGFVDFCIYQPMSRECMRRFILSLAFSLLIVASLAAQGNGYGNGGNGNNGNGNGGYGNNGNGNGGNGNNGFGQGNSPWANANWPQWLINWLENGGQIPPLLAMDVIWEARPWGQQQFGLSYGQLLQKYAQGSLTLEYISTAPPTLAFRVRFGGLSIDVIADL